ncbi:hypothetical protein BUALT_Bualt07G0122800 [Buddleja alternifolia]|uniref:DDE Tnp4 domain-containing protein n=1 Tax=Buddleja alternifolia TaxID=168488 RepID=A0AAV6XHY4_9LAMI|nr:hypothetical protein BUALT_Bualt07G0122800 [Buddleja alternifolia]
MEPWKVKDYASTESWSFKDCALVQQNIPDDEKDEHTIHENMEWLILCQLTATSILTYVENYIHKVPCRTSIRTGHKFIEEILNGHGMRCYQDFRLTKPVFMELCRELTYKYGLQPTRAMSIYEEVGIFLMMCAHGVDNRLMQEIFNHSGETISRHFHRVLKVIGKLAGDIIKPHPNYNDGEGYHKPQHCRIALIGAIDGTHVKVRLPQGQAIPYIGRKGFATQNILAVVDFNMCFTFAWAGWEGAAHDNRIFGEAIRGSNLNFPHPKGKKYYLVDAGYSHRLGYMGPYKGENIRYHLEDFRRARTSQLRAPRNMKEKFNYLHSSCRNIVERTFGVWKARWNILANMPYYHIDTQREIVLATMAVHNYIRKKNVADHAFLIAEDESYEPDIERDIEAFVRVMHSENGNDQNNIYWMAVRVHLQLT